MDTNNDMFSLIGAVEKAGSGADTIVQGWHEAKFETPTIIERSEPNKVELTLPINTMTSNGDSNGDGKRYNFSGTKGLLQRIQ